MAILLQGTCTPLVHTHAGRTLGMQRPAGVLKRSERIAASGLAPGATFRLNSK